MKLADICEINPRAELLDDNTLVSFVAMPDVSEDGKINVDTHRTYGEVKKGFTNFKEGDVLFAKITPCMENGKGALATGLENGLGFGSTEFHVLRPDAAIVLGQWLYYLTSWSAFRKDAERHMTGSAGQKRVPKSFLEKYEVDLPTIDDQKYQVLQLNRIRKIIDTRQQQLSALDDLIKARFVEMFGDPVSKQGPKEKLSETGKVYTGNTPSMKIPEYYESDGIPFIKPGDIAESGVTIVQHVGAFISEKGRDAARVMPKGSVLVTCIGTIGKVGIAAQESCCNQQINFIIPNDRYNPIYLAHCLSFFKDALADMANAPVVPIINKSQFSALEIPTVSKIEQDSFAFFVSQVDKSKFVVQKALDETQVLFDSLMQEYFG